MRFRCLLCALLLSLLLFGGKAGTAAPAEPPLFSPSEIMTPEQIRPGMTGYAKTVFQGNKVETYGIKVIGVMRGYYLATEDSDALLPEAILIRVTSGPIITRQSGIIAGMSGSPVYINGKLIGAIAFGFPFCKEPLAGVTPITHMAEKFAAPPALASGPGPAALFRALDKRADSVLVPTAGALEIGGQKITRAELRYRRPKSAPADKQTAVLTPLAAPLLVNGLSPRALKILGTVLEPYGLMAVPGGGKSPIKTPYKPVPGSSIGLQLAGGDVDLALFGTVTAVKGNKILALGHTAFGSGLFALPMVNSYIQDIIPHQEFSYVMASGGATIGRWTEDRPYALKGFLGENARTIPGTFSVLDAERGISKKYAVDFCDHRDLTPIYMAVVAQLTADATTISTEGTLSSEFEITAPGLSPYRRQNLYSPSPLEPSDFMSMLLGRGSSSPAREIYQVLDTLMNNPYYPVSPKGISFSAKWQSGTRAAEIIEVSSHQRRVRPGDTVDIELTLQPWKKPRETRALQVAIPENVPPGKLQIGLAGGGDGRRLKRRLGIEEPAPVDLPGMLAVLANQEKNNQLLTEVLLGTTGLEAEGKQLNNLPQVIIEALSAANGRNLRIIHDHAPSLQALPYVLTGEAVLDFVVETDQKEKAGRASLAGARGERDFSDSLLREADAELEDGGDEEEGMTSASSPRLSGTEEDLFPEGDEAPEMPSFEELDEIAEENGGEEAVVTPKPAALAPSPAGKISLRKPQLWTDTAEKDFAKGKTETTAVNTAGKVELAPPAKELHRAPEIIWPAAADPTGRLYLGAWFDGKVKAVTSAGERLALDTKDTAVTALACDSAGLTYAAAAPSGAIHRITGEGKTSLFGKVPAPYVWALRSQPDATLLAATGPEGKLFRLSPEGKCEFLFAAPDRHIIALASAPDGACYFATYPKGKVYRLKDGKISPYYETPPQFTALSLAADSAGNLFIGTSPTAQVIALDSQGKARLLFKSKEKHVFSLWPATDGSLYAATGPHARLYRISQNGDSALVWDDKLGYLVNLAPAPGALQATLADSRRVMTFDLKSPAQGRYLSTVYDAGVPSRWGRLNWQGDRKPGEAITLETRSGSTAFPDATWSDWAAVSADYEGPNIASPQSRYLQYRATLCAAAPAVSVPVLRQVQVSYLTLNRPPELKLVDPAQEAAWSGKKSIKWQATDPDKDSLSYQVFYSADAGAAWTEIKEAEKAKTAGALKNPAASEDDPPGASDKSAKPEEKAEPPAPPAEAPPALKPTSMAWDTKKVADGTYLIRVIASDKLSNPKDALSAEKISDPLTLDNSAPLIMREVTNPPAAPPTKLKIVDGGYVASAEYRVDEGDWHPAFCEDGLYDGPAEYALLEAANLPAGEHLLQIRARDGLGNEAKEELQYKKPE